MSTKIRLKRFGALKRPQYRLVVVDSRKPRDGRTLDEIGLYHPLEASKEKQVYFDVEKVKIWLQKGAIPTHTVQNILKKNMQRMSKEEGKNA